MSAQSHSSRAASLTGTGAPSSSTGAGTPRIASASRSTSPEPPVATDDHPAPGRVALADRAPADGSTRR
ncbi:hypothetical protein, partial [Cellulomonas uda]|uniref:hypothetical protein n=1 Tax=Cellulomonas uda TaxID=1714 RepID=UPI001FD37C72